MLKKLILEDVLIQLNTTFLKNTMVQKVTTLPAVVLIWKVMTFLKIMMIQRDVMFRKDIIVPIKEPIPLLRDAVIPRNASKGRVPFDTTYDQNPSY
ncbi:hypothetical protein V6N13_025305 [Hibiscus sabdariffa]